MKLGLVTYNLAHDWSLAELLANCAETGFEGVELRTTHAHGVEPSLSLAERADVRRRFADSPVTLWGLGSVCEFDSLDAAEVRRQVEAAKAFCQLAADVGASGVKVRPNRLHPEVPAEQTCDQIGAALREVGQAADDLGVDIYLEVHGSGTHKPELVARMLDTCGHPRVGACWNSNFNADEVREGSIGETFGLLAGRINSCHITELWQPVYPWRELFALLSASGYKGFTLAEIPASPDALRLMRYYRALWEALQPEGGR